MPSKTVAIIKKDFHAAGGLEKSTSKILSALAKHGADISIFKATPGELPYASYSYTPRGIFKAQKLKSFDNWLSHTLSTSSFDVILSMDRSSTQTHHRAGNGVHKAYLDLRAQVEGKLKKWSFLLNPLHTFQLQLEKTTFESEETRAIIVNSSMVRDQILHYYNTPSSKIHIIQNSIEWNELEAHFNDSMVHKKEYALDLGLDPSVFQFLFVGHNFERKGLATLIKALALLKEKSFHLSVVGHDKNIGAYKALSSRLDLESQITFFGSQPSSRPFYLAADAAIIPSIYDPFANVTLEALALGLFVISSKMNGGHEVLKPYSGITFENPHDIEELSTALAIALKNPKEFSRGSQIRASVSHLDDSLQLEKMCKLCLG